MEAVVASAARFLAQQDTGEFADYAVRGAGGTASTVYGRRLFRIWLGLSLRRARIPHVSLSSYPLAFPSSPLSPQKDLWLFFGIQFLFFAATPAIIMSYRLLLNWREGFMGMFRVRGDCAGRTRSARRAALPAGCEPAIAAHAAGRSLLAPPYPFPAEEGRRGDGDARAPA